MEKGKQDVGLLHHWDVVPLDNVGLLPVTERGNK